MNELYEFMKQVDVIVLFCLIYGLAINGMLLLRGCVCPGTYRIWV